MKTKIDTHTKKIMKWKLKFDTLDPIRWYSHVLYRIRRNNNNMLLRLDYIVECFKKWCWVGSNTHTQQVSTRYGTRNVYKYYVLHAQTFRTSITIEFLVANTINSKSGHSNAFKLVIYGNLMRKNLQKHPTQIWKWLKYKME